MKEKSSHKGAHNWNDLNLLCANYTAAFGGLTHVRVVRVPQSEDLLKTQPLLQACL